MMGGSGRVGLAAVLVFVAGGVATAQDLWLQPEPAAPLPGQEVTLRLVHGDWLDNRELGLKPDRTLLFQRVWKQGRENLGGEADATPAARFAPAESGLQLVAYSYRARTGEGDGYYCKAFVIVGDAPEDSPIRYSEVGQRLELVPQTDPVALSRRGGMLELQVLFEREPLAGVVVAALPEAAPREGALTATTDEIGLVRLALDRPGRWLVIVRYKRPDSRSHAALLLDVGPSS